MPGLTDNQETIVSSIGVEALARRFLHLLTQGLAEPAQILVLAGSNRAVEALTDLLHSLCGRRALEGAHIQTIHGFCSRVLRENALIAGVDPGFSIL
ncbi:MAG: UvrD-helicase domain-containing protein, partial [Armatimonadetes bacterium]|nr:UvrD-helicase domain-containing protein [Armatimonadota bacterium]